MELSYQEMLSFFLRIELACQTKWGRVEKVKSFYWLGPLGRRCDTELKRSELLSSMSARIAKTTPKGCNSMADRREKFGNSFRSQPGGALSGGAIPQILKRFGIEQINRVQKWHSIATNSISCLKGPFSVSTYYQSNMINLESFPYCPHSSSVECKLWQDI